MGEWKGNQELDWAKDNSDAIGNQVQKVPNAGDPALTASYGTEGLPAQKTLGPELVNEGGRGSYDVIAEMRVQPNWEVARENTNDVNPTEGWKSGQKDMGPENQKFA